MEVARVGGPDRDAGMEKIMVVEIQSRYGYHDVGAAGCDTRGRDRTDRDWERRDGKDCCLCRAENILLPYPSLNRYAGCNSAGQQSRGNNGGELRAADESRCQRGIDAVRGPDRDAICAR